MKDRLIRSGREVLLDGRAFAVAQSDEAAQVLIIAMSYVLDSYPYMRAEELDLVDRVIDPVRFSRNVVDAINKKMEGDQ